MVTAIFVMSTTGSNNGVAHANINHLSSLTPGASSMILAQSASQNRGICSGIWNTLFGSCDEAAKTSEPEVDCGAI